MSEGVLAAIITGVISLIGMIVTTAVSSGSARRLMEYQIGELKEDLQSLSARVNRQNELAERIAAAEQSVRSAHHRLDELKGGTRT